ncbi:hypothetical protein B0H11DRAFT_2251154 [Mycena galericulata]|nr:hypothetical protein B0H11DRAFT_2251154 [Mycena galericulata]
MGSSRRSAAENQQSVDVGGAQGVSNGYAITKLGHKLVTKFGPPPYTAPAACGSGEVRVFLDFEPNSEYYRPSRDPTEHPDAIVALNAGLGSYISWHHVILLSSEFGIPFAVTDYVQGSLAQVRMDAMEQALTSTLPPPKTTEQICYQARGDGAVPV